MERHVKKLLKKTHPLVTLDDLGEPWREFDQGHWYLHLAGRCILFGKKHGAESVFILDRNTHNVAGIYEFIAELSNHIILDADHLELVEFALYEEGYATDEYEYDAEIVSTVRELRDRFLKTKGNPWKRVFHPSIQILQWIHFAMNVAGHTYNIHLL